MKRKLFLIATTVIASVVISCKKDDATSEIVDPITPVREYVREFMFTASSAGTFDKDWNEYFSEHYGLLAPGFASTASVTFLDNASFDACENEVLDFIEQGKICVVVKPDDDFADWLKENLPDIGAVCGVLETDDIVFAAVTNDAIFIQHKDNVEAFNPQEHRAPDEEMEEGEETTQKEESLDDPLNYQFVIEWMEGIINEHFMDQCATKSSSVIPLPENDEYRKAKHYAKRTDNYKCSFKMLAKRQSFYEPTKETSGEVAVEYIFTPLYCYQEQGPQDPGDYYLVERNLYVMSSDTEKWTGGCVRKWYFGIRWYARGGYLYTADVATTLNITKAKCTAEMIGTVSPQSQNNVTTYTSNYSENMGVKIAPSIGITKGQAPGASVSLGDLFNWGKSYSRGKQANLKDFSILNHTAMGASPVKHTARYEEKAFPELSADKYYYGKAADLAVSTAIFPSHWIWHISGTTDDMTDSVGYITTRLDVTWGWSHRSSNSSSYDPVHPYDDDCCKNKSSFTIDNIKLTLPAPSRVSYGRIVLKNDSDKYLYGLKVIDKDDPTNPFEFNVGTIAPGKEIILTASQNKPNTTTPIKYTIECRIGPNGQSLETYKYNNTHYGDYFSISKCLDRDRDSFNISIVSDMVKKVK